VRAQSEAAFQRQVIEVLKLNGWSVYHTHDSRRSEAGYPDLTGAHPDRGIIFAELKSQKGRVRPEQTAWLDTLRLAGARAYLWRPSDWPEITTIASGEGP